MKIEIIVAFVLLFLIPFVANLIHWRFHRAERLFYFPESGWSRGFFLVLTTATAITPAFVSTGDISARIYLIELFCWLTAMEIYSIVVRCHLKSKVHDIPTV